MVSANPTGPITVASARNGAIGDSVARQLEFRATRSRASTTTTTPARRWSASTPRSRRSGAARSRPRTATGATTSPCSPPRGGPGAEDARQIKASLERFRIHFDSWVLQSELETRLPEYLPRLDTYEKDGAVWARSSAYGDDDDRVMIRSPEKGGTPTSAPPTSSTSRTSSTAASTGRSTCSAPTTTARGAGTRRSRGCSATTRSVSKCCSTSSST